MKDSPVDSVATAKVVIDWYRSTPWWRVASQSIVISWRSTHLLLCAAGLLLTQLWLSASLKIFGPENAIVQSWISPSAGSQTILPILDAQGTESPLSIWQHFLFPVYQWLANPTLNGTAFCLSSVIGIVTIWSFVGGCLTRRSVVELGTKMTAPWAGSIQLVLKRWQSIAWSVTMPSGLILLIALGPLCLGWISNFQILGLGWAGWWLFPVLFC